MDDLPLISTIAAGFTAAWVLGLLTQALRLSPIVGYLLAGIMIGPHSPGFRADSHLAHQLAEVGVILLMFGVGLHFRLGELLAVRSIAVPGAVGRSAVALIATLAVLSFMGYHAADTEYVRFSFPGMMIVGLAVSVASTVVLLRVLMDADMLQTPAGHIAVGWLIVEDILTIMVLVLIPIWGANLRQSTASEDSLALIGIAVGKLLALIVIVFVLGRRVIPWALTQVARLRSRELFTLTVMVFSIAMAAGAYALFGASMALGAFLAGMVVGQSSVSHQAAADALPLRDAFAVLFFVSVGMLFDPGFLLREPLLMAAVLVVIVLVKPLAALLLVTLLGHSARTGLTVALATAQIGEFSFILSELGRKHLLGRDESEIVNHMLVGAAILSIMLTPMWFRSLEPIEAWLKRRPRLWYLLNIRAERRLRHDNRRVRHDLESPQTQGRRAIVVGYGPVGQTVNRLLRDAGLETVVIDMNMDTVSMLREEGQQAIFGDAAREAILASAGAAQAAYIVLTLPQNTDRTVIVATARNLSADTKIFVRARYLRERDDLAQVGATAAVFEEAEAAVALARAVLTDTGASRDSIEQSLRGIRTRLILDNVSALQSRTVRSIMIPWTRVRKLRQTMSYEEVRRHLSEQRYSRWPVVQSDTGLPAGYLLAKDLISVSAERPEWISFVRPLKTISPDASVESVLQEFQQDGGTLGIVSEGGIPLGLVTVEDLLEQVIGRIEDEYPRHEKKSITDLILIDAALLELSSQAADAAIMEIARVIPAARLPVGVDVAALAIERERECSTHLGFGVAVPHARCPGLVEPMVVFARSHNGVVFDSATQRVHLIFLLVTPLDQPQVQVQILGDIAAIASREESRRKLLAAQTVGEVQDLFSAGG